jgi:hypothetical protein
MEKKEQTKEEKEKQIAEQMEKQREIALKNLDSSLWNYATPKLITSDQYGKISELANLKYETAISKSPEQSVYEQLFLPQLNKEGGAITSPYVQSASKAILEESFGSIKVEDALKYIGSSGNIKDSFKGKYIGMLQDKEGNNPLINYLMSYKTQDIASGLLGESKKMIASGLEEMLIEKPKEDKEGKKA